MRKSITILLALMFVFPGCLDDEGASVEDILDEENIEGEGYEGVCTDNCQESECDGPGIGDCRQCVEGFMLLDADGDGYGECIKVFEPHVPELVEVPQEEGCDNINPLHCMFPFPSNAFLSEDSSTVTGYRVNYTKTSVPGSGTFRQVEIPGLNRLDGMSPSTQILTAFDEDPVLTAVANQSAIEKSLIADHATILINLDTGERLPHWVELDSRTDNKGPTILYIRTIRGLDHNTAYGVGISGLTNSTGDLISPSLAFKALIEGDYTDAPDVELRAASFDNLFVSLESHGYSREDLQAAWEFHTASTESIVGGMLHMREDALTRLGDEGIGCNVTSTEDNYGNDNMTFRRVRGTITTPQYLLNPDEPPSLMSRDSNGTPLFTGYSEVPFTLIIPQVLADNNTSGPLVVFGHGFMGTGEATISGSRGWSQAYGASLLATDWYGWSQSDYDTVIDMLVQPAYFEHQTDRLQQAMVNKITMVRTMTGVCSDIPELYADETNLVDTDEVYYMGYSLGGIYGGTFMALSPDIDRGVLWVGGSGFASMIERSTNYNQFELIFNSILGYTDRNDRAILISLGQQLWDSTDPDIYLNFISDGYGGVLGPKTILAVYSVNDAQVPMLSSDRACRAADIPVLSTSTRLPYGVDVVEGPIEGSAAVFFDGNFPAVPEGNSGASPEYHSLAHNLIAGVPEVNAMVFGFMLTGIVENTCEDICTFEAEW